MTILHSAAAFWAALLWVFARPTAPTTDWPSVGGDPGCMRYSALKQITTANVKNLQVAWIYHTGDRDAAHKSAMECTPVVADGVMYITTARNSVVALDAAIVTAGGLVFIGGSMDEKFRAFDKATGKILFEYKLDAGGYATPCTYAVGGRQFVVIAAGGGGKPGTRSGDAFVAFALPP